MTISLYSQSLQFETSDLSDLTIEYFAEELDTTQESSTVGERIQLLGGTKQGFKRPVAPGRRRPTHA